MGHGGGVGLALVLCVGAPATVASNDLDAGGGRAFFANLTDVAGLPELVRDTMAEEAALILAAAGLDLTWREAPAGTETPEGRIKLVILPFSARQAPPGRCLLGSADTNAVSPTAWVHYPDVARTLGIEAESITTLRFEEQRRVGAALGRVAAHELVHLVLPGRGHTERGLMAVGTNRRWLLQRWVALDDESSQALRTALAARR